jgi:hypothetical protein
MNIERVKNMWVSLMRIDEIMKENGFNQEKIWHSGETYFADETLKIRAQILTEDLNFYHLYGSNVIFSYKFNEFLNDDLSLDEKKFIEIVKSVKENFLLESVKEDFR